MNSEQQAMRQGVLASTADLSAEPRINPKQREAIEATVRADPETRLLGLDRNLRPVVRARTGIPRRVTTWAILRNGDPTDADGIRVPYHADTGPVIRNAIHTVK